MNFKRYTETPLQLSISFHMVIERLEEIAKGEGFAAQRAQYLLKLVQPYPELREGTDNVDWIAAHLTIISELLADLFPEMLTGNEIKAITVPFQDILINPTKRLQQILAEAGPAFDITIRDFNDHQLYVNTCCIILNEHYGTNFNFSRPLFYDIPNAQGIMKHYRILYNADYMEMIPTERAVKITPDDIELLRDNFEDLELWKKFFPPGSWILKGFAIVSLYDATVENAISALKGSLLGIDYDDELHIKILEVFRSIYKLPDMKLGFTSFDEADNKFNVSAFTPAVKSYLLNNEGQEECFEAICERSMSRIVFDRKYLAISDLPKFLSDSPGNVMAKRFLEQGIKSVIMAPVVKNNHLLGVIELVSPNIGDLNSINANQLQIVMPYITDTIDRQFSYMQSQIQALIQNEYTTIHPSVYWKFRKEAMKAITAHAEKRPYTLKEITFTDVTPLYGQIDIKGSSETRNRSVQLDLQEQLTALIPIVEEICSASRDENIRQNIHNLQELVMDVQSALKADTEQLIQNYLETHIHPLLKNAENLDDSQRERVNKYFLEAGKTGDYHKNRRKYEETVSVINQKMASLIDKAQIDAQAAFPHYYERFKTDGIEHNMYIGASIAPAKMYDDTKLYNLRLWQLQIMCQMELEHRFLQADLPYALEVASLILVSSQEMSIRFRMDEKHFDVDGSYNARFEIVKKRIDKAVIKGTTERLTAVGKLTIVYSNHDEEEEYLQYLHFLQQKQLLENDIEMLEVEDLQGVSGLKALRVGICYNASLPVRKFYTYKEMLDHQKKITVA
ncbi:MULTISPECIES: GAF domain-containing protein [unclassified Mucilaginibacter]|uniref:GAF domain-containing protein n=1 Tax=unclassified Mucilaginibacter TaxID=2617802 RepID=UPI00095EAB28|nr:MULTISPECIES: GAF domain-containing protein [unclassified Mucilaginibacter]OJW15923.1 MAG: GAF domain-containing protein [Mucilaginibacter sp. 44-25]PLW88332.1 MAG: GAF domain-containing protein [Mucilaginibacter sp.]PMP64878.1 MAG: GAF domain-containing protein [Mucilaginibacter sp.]HEK22274.1 GAF domain-containing protein [Bacteroidota bacterium]